MVWGKRLSCRSRWVKLFTAEILADGGLNIFQYQFHWPIMTLFKVIISKSFIDSLTSASAYPTILGRHIWLYWEIRTSIVFTHSLVHILSIVISILLLSKQISYPIQLLLLPRTLLLFSNESIPAETGTLLGGEEKESSVLGPCTWRKKTWQVVLYIHGCCKPDKHISHTHKHDLKWCTVCI